MKRSSIGMIETWGYTAAVEAADTGMKAANVRLLGVQRVGSALWTVSFTGEVAAVKSAVNAALASVARIGRVVAHHVIPRPDASVYRRLGISLPPDPEDVPPRPPSGTPQTEATGDGPESSPADDQMPAPETAPETVAPGSDTLSPPDETSTPQPEEKVPEEVPEEVSETEISEPGPDTTPLSEPDASEPALTAPTAALPEAMETTIEEPPAPEPPAPTIDAAATDQEPPAVAPKPHKVGETKVRGPSAKRGRKPAARGGAKTKVSKE